jgi:HAE1 family hydrophobic/amphiphilic exporter-1
MSLINSSIKNPIPVFVGTFFIFIFGAISFFHMPYQLSPSVDEPMVSVKTEWIGATPYEVEREIIEEQEKVLKGLPDMIEMESSANNGYGEVMITFRIGTDINQAMNRVANKLNEVPYYPENVENPVVKRSGEAQAPKIWMVLSTADDNRRSINSYRTYLEDELLPYLLRIKGVADIVIFGGAKSQMEVVLDFVKMASYGITVPEVIETLQDENRNIPAGIRPVGAKDYRVRTTAQFNSPEEIENAVVKADSHRVVRIGDIAYVKRGIARLKTYFRFDRMKDPGSVDSLRAAKSPRYKLVHTGKGQTRWHRTVSGLDIGVKAEADANIIELTELLEKKVDELNENLLSGEGLFLEIVYDERDYPLAALSIVTDNIIIGCLLAIFVLFIFLRNVSSTVVIAFVIPVTAVSTFSVMYSLGLSLNVVSLAGISFAVGMLVDNAIVVIENIDRHKSMGKPVATAAHQGAAEVWAAVLASTLTTIAVFLPVVFVQQEAGQLFRDISIAVSAAIFLSLIASVLVVPTLTNLLSPKQPAARKEKSLAPWRHKINEFLTSVSIKILDRFTIMLKASARNWKTRLAVILGFLMLSVVTTVLLMPKMEYLPQGNMNFLLNILIPPAGTSYEEREEIATEFYKQIEPHFGVAKDGYPSVEYTFFVGGEELIFCGAQASDEERCGELIPLFAKAANNYPGVFGISMQTGIFQNRLGRARTVSLDISGYEQEDILKVADILKNKEIPEYIEGSQIRAVPDLDVSYPEIRFVPVRERLKAVGMSAEDIGKTIDVMLNGRKIGDYKQEGSKKIDFIVKAPRSSMMTPEDIYNSTVPIPGGKSTGLSELVELKRTFGLTQIRHLDTKRTITIEITPPMDIPLQQAMQIVDEKIIPKIEKQGLLENVEIESSGNASKFTETQQALKWNFMLAVLILYFIMAVIFKNFLYPLIVLFTIPFAMAGGFVGLKLADIFIADTPFDIMTMLGFIMLIGMMVNNPILIIHQSINNIRHRNMNYKDAVIEATRSRIRPIYMSVFTTIFGMLPLVVAPGAGSELYRGLGSVVLSGLFISTFFTIFVIPNMLLFFVKKK